MGRASPGVDDNLHSSQGRRHRQLDSLHEGQEGSQAVVCGAHCTDQNGVPASQIKTVTRAIILLLLINTTDAFVKVSVSNSSFLVPEGTAVNLTCSFSDDQGAGLEEVSARWRKMDQDHIMMNGVTTVWNVTQQKGYTVLQVPNVTSNANGVYSCIVWIRMSFDYGYVKIQTLNFTHNESTTVQLPPPHMQSARWNDPTSIYVKTGRVTRQTHASQISQVPHRKITQENLVVGLIRDFGRVQNVSKITACLPMPQSAGDPIPWGVIPVPEVPKMFRNTTWNCKFVTTTSTDLTLACLLTKVKTKNQCKEMPGFWQWLNNPIGDQIKGNCVVSPSAVILNTPCKAVKVPILREKREQVCQNITSSTTMTEWQTIWGPSLLEVYSYIGQVQWCIHWVGTTNQDYSFLHPKHKQWREIVSPTGLWNCTRIYTCDTPNNDISLVPVRMLLQLGCECRGYNHSMTGHNNLRSLDCLTTTVASPGNLVWVMGHGQWTTHMPVDGPATQITLGVPTLCPYWKSGKLTTLDMQPRQKRDTEQDSENWHDPSDGVKFGWAMESLFAPIASYRNREMLFKLMRQTERLAAVTKKGFRDMNVQLQATTRMTIQNRMALDLILLKQHGVCGYLHARDEHCCVHIPNVTHEIENDISQLEQIEGNMHKLQQ
ncbi:uncharacterized protein LOC126653140 isoform X1 [Myiozetetes cayanensis]|uniref:uncharacterized protein LOC126653140 isoform X1 n=1 Tax=Myiozetetes cayanensis TaxID=478635 RepID=UPI0021601C46|nr:uncharacterized protein LOC126653140 isoform X1 [Myiozetetes cayanensis]